MSTLTAALGAVDLNYAFRAPLNISIPLPPVLVIVRQLNLLLHYRCHDHFSQLNPHCLENLVWLRLRALPRHLFHSGRLGHIGCSSSHPSYHCR